MQMHYYYDTISQCVMQMYYDTVPPSEVELNRGLWVSGGRNAVCTCAFLFPFILPSSVAHEPTCPSSAQPSNNYNENEFHLLQRCAIDKQTAQCALIVCKELTPHHSTFDMVALQLSVR